MSEVVPKRQFITDSAGKPVGVTLPLEQFALAEAILEQQFPTTNNMEKLERMRQAAHDPRFLADFRETTSAFARADAECSELGRWYRSDGVSPPQKRVSTQ
jgi:hypothetical protein